MSKLHTIISNGIFTAVFGICSLSTHASLVKNTYSQYNNSPEFSSFYIAGMSSSNIAVHENTVVTIPVDIQRMTEYRVESTSNIVTAVIDDQQLILTVGEVEDDMPVNLSLVSHGFSKSVDLTVNVINQPTLAINNYGNLAIEDLLLSEDGLKIGKYGFSAAGFNNAFNVPRASTFGLLRQQAGFYSSSQIGRASKSNGSTRMSGLVGSYNGRVLAANDNFPLFDLGQYENISDPLKLIASELTSGLPAIRKYIIDYQPTPSSGVKVNLLNVEPEAKKYVANRVAKAKANLPKTPQVNQSPAVPPSGDNEQEENFPNVQVVNNPPPIPQAQPNGDNPVVLPDYDLPEQEQQAVAQEQAVSVSEPTTLYVFAIALAGLMLVNRTPHSRHL